jgi:tetratricopeptide (TPR) repeat protein
MVRKRTLEMRSRLSLCVAALSRRRPKTAQHFRSGIVIFYLLVSLAVLGQSDAREAQTGSFPPAMHQGRIEYDSGHFANAEKLFTEALVQLGDRDESKRAKILADLGSAYGKQEAFQKAEVAYSESLSISKRLGEKNVCALMLHNLGMLYSRQGRNDEAIQFLNKAQEYIQSNPDADPRITAEVLNGMGLVLYRRGDNGKAVTYLNRALKAVSSTGIEFDAAGIYNNLGATYVAKHNYSHAEETLKRALSMKEEKFGLSHPTLIPTLNLIGLVYAETRRFAEAEDQYNRSLKILGWQGSGLALKTAETLHGLSDAYRKANRKAESAATLEQAAQIAQTHLDEEPEMVVIAEEYSKVLKAQGKAKEAEELRAKAGRARTMASLVARANSLVQ